MKIAKISKAVVETATNFNKGDPEELLEVIPEELSNEELLGLGQEHIAEEARVKATAGEEKEKPPKRVTVKALAEAP